MKDQCYIIRLDGKCNEKCLFCMESDNINSGKIIEFNQVAKEIIAAKNNGFTHIDFYGGEPTTYEFLKKAIYLCNKLGLKVTLATNGLKFYDPKYTEEFFRDIEIIGIRTSLHSHRAEIHDKITVVKTSWKRTIEGLKNMLKYNKKITLNVVITIYNYTELMEIVEFVHGLGIRGIKYSGIIFSGDAKNHSYLYVEEQKYQDLLINTLKKAIELGFYQIEVEKMSPSLLNTLTSEEKTRVRFIHELDNGMRFVPILVNKVKMN